MTAEIAIMNKEAVALAADSAATVAVGDEEGRQIFTSVNKLFALSKYHPVGTCRVSEASVDGRGSTRGRFRALGEAPRAASCARVLFVG